MTSLLAPGLRGALRPRVRRVPSCVSSAGREAVELAASAGLILDDWQGLVLDDGLGERADGKWAAFEVGLIVSRQNGKGSVLEARELAGLFLFGEQLILHSAHEFKTAAEAFRRILTLIEGSDDLRRRVLKVSRSNGEEGVEVRGGGRLRFVARSGGSGRGFTGDCIILDEAYNLTQASMAALLPTLSARPNPQIWYTSSAGTPDSEVLASVRRRGVEGSSGRLAYLEFSADADANLDDRDAWAMANPALGIRISEEFIENERGALGDEEFARERLGIWSGVGYESVIDLAHWSTLADPDSQIVGAMAFAAEISPDRKWSTISAVGGRSDGLAHVEVIEHSPGTQWVAGRLWDLQSHRPCATVIDPASPAGSLIPELAEAGIDVTTPGGRDVAQAAGMFFDAVAESQLRHLGQEPLTQAIAAAKKQPKGDAFVWSRKSLADITELTSATLALWGWMSKRLAVVDMSTQIW